MLSLITGLVPLLLAGLLGWAGAVKALGRNVVRTAPKTALARLLSSSERAVLVLRATGWAELLLAGALLAVPGSALPGAATAVLGAAFLGYLGYGRARAPQASCGCSASEDTPVTWRAFARAALVLTGGVTAAVARRTWWGAPGDRPVTSAVLLVVGALVLFALSADLDRWWLLPLRRTRLRVFGHPLTGGGGTQRVPVAASVELLENSLAWQTTSPVVRSALLDHWESDGWRILHYSGVHGEGDAARPVAVLFALDASVGRDTPGDPVIRVSYVDADTGAPVAAGEPRATPARRSLRLVD
ncbi:MauE/DoxX family redox-associated membrane protein [Streptomyces sp. NPDC090119]|uniref:MauE/DoxX family redox-associated membrane protein n=1 Tax=Streptomyces sp. NPDC090119 TaxID=3365951 RepID=UPI0037F95E66